MSSYIQKGLQVQYVYYGNTKTVHQKLGYWPAKVAGCNLHSGHLRSRRPTLLVHLLTSFIQLTKLYSISFWREEKRELKENNDLQDNLFSRVQHMVCCIPYYNCCCDCSETYVNYSFCKEQYSSHSCHVLGNKLDRGWYVCWRNGHFRYSISFPFLMLRSWKWIIPNRLYYC